MGNVFSGLFFFLLGYGLKDKEKSYALIIVAVVVFLIFIIGHCTRLIDFPYLYMHANSMYNGNYLLFYPMAVAGIIISNNLFRKIYAKNLYSFIILEYIGRNSMNIYVTHWILLVLVSFIAKSLFHIESAAILFYCFLGASIIFLPIICYFMNKIGEQNKMVK